MDKPQSSFMGGFSESYLADLGRLVAAWSQVEQQFLIFFLSKVVMRGASSGTVKTKQVQDLMSLPLKVQLREFRKRLDELMVTGPDRKRYEQIFSRLESLRNERDYVAHSQWSPDFGEGEATAIFKSWKNFDDHEFKTVTQDRLLEIFRRIEALYWDLFDLQLHGPSVPPMKYKPSR